MAAAAAGAAAAVAAAAAAAVAAVVVVAIWVPTREGPNKPDAIRLFLFKHFSTVQCFTLMLDIYALGPHPLETAGWCWC